jgi:hypothetical protein
MRPLRALPSVVVRSAIVLLVAGCAQSGVPSGSPPSSVAPSSPTLPPTVGPSPSAVEPSPSVAVTSIPLSLGAGHTLTLTVTDRSAQLLEVRSAKPEELAAPDPESANADIFAYTPADGGSDQLVVVWTGVICDRAADLVIEPGVDKVAVQAHRADPCDAMAVPSGVVLTFDRPIDPSTLSLDLSHL